MFVPEVRWDSTRRGDDGESEISFRSDLRVLKHQWEDQQERSKDDAVVAA